MRLGLVVLVLALGGASVQAQGNPMGQLSFSRGQPLSTLRTYDFGKMTLTRPLPTLRTYDFGKMTLARSEPTNLTLTCPMPVFRSGFDGDPMPVARGGSAEPMPVARSGCWNPLDPPSLSDSTIAIRRWGDTSHPQRPSSDGAGMCSLVAGIGPPALQRRRGAA